MKSNNIPSGKKVVYISTLVDIIDVIMNASVALLTGSIVMLAEALQGVADLIVDIFLIIGLHRSSKPADTKHPFGYGRELYFWALMAGVAMFAITGGFSVYFGWNQLTNPEPISNLWLAVGVLGISVVTNLYSWSLSTKRLLRGRRVSNLWTEFKRTTHIETKTTFIADMIGFCAAIIGLISLAVFSLTGNLAFDGIGAMLIGLAIGGFAILLVSSIKALLIGQTAPPHIKSKIRRAALQIPEIKDILGMWVVIIGPDKFLVNLEVHANQKLTTKELERVIDEVKAKILEEVPMVHHVQVELETP